MFKTSSLTKIVTLVCLLGFVFTVAIGCATRGELQEVRATADAAKRGTEGGRAAKAALDELTAKVDELSMKVDGAVEKAEVAADRAEVAARRAKAAAEKAERIFAKGLRK